MNNGDLCSKCSPPMLSLSSSLEGSENWRSSIMNSCPKKLKCIFLYRPYSALGPIQSVGPLKACYIFPPMADLFVPTPTRLLREAFGPCSNYAQRLLTNISTTVYSSFIQLTELGRHGENENAQTSKRQQRLIPTRAPLIACPASYRCDITLHYTIAVPSIYT